MSIKFNLFYFLININLNMILNKFAKMDDPGHDPGICGEYRFMNFSFYR